MNLLIADDEPQMVKIISDYFINEGFNVFKAYDGMEAIEIFDQEEIHLVILDWMMPKLDGIEVCHYIKERSQVPVIMLTAKGQQDDELKALTVGADDYVKKPFDARILIARAKRLLHVLNSLAFEEFRVDTEAQKVYRNGQFINLTKIEYDLLCCFIRNKGVILSRNRLLDLVWGADYEGDSRTVDTHIRRLRTKIGEGYIRTYRGIGYSMEGDFN